MKQALKKLDPLIDVAMKSYQQQYRHYEGLKLQAQNNKTELPIPPIQKRYKTDDPTIEALGPILRDNPQGILLFRDELSGWIKGMSKKGHENDRAFYLEAWNASNNFTTDRVGRGMIHIPALCLSVFGSIQPGPLSAYIQQMHSGRDWDDGFFQRFQIMVWPKEIEWRPYSEHSDEVLDQNIQDICCFLDSLKFDHQGNPIVLTFTEGAQRLFGAWQTDLHPRIRSNDLPEFMKSHLSKYTKLLPTIALILEHAQSALIKSKPTAVSAESFYMARLWCEYLERHAWKVYGCNHEELKKNTLNLIEKVRSNALSNGFKIRDVYHGHHWSGLATADEVQKVCDFAESINWTVKIDERSNRTVQRYYVHPDLLEEKAG